MTTAEKTQRINQVLHDYFARNKAEKPILAKEFMVAFIKAGIFSADRREGLPIRNLLRDLDRTKQLHLIPYIIPVRKAQNTNWFFGPAASAPRVSYQQKEKLKVTSRKAVASSGAKPRSHSDECYVLDLCDEILGLKSIRQHKFPFLVGDPNSSGRSARLPVDAWYELLNLVIEFNERQHTEAVKLFDRRMTVSGITRGEQRTIYDNRKQEVLPKHGIRVLVLDYSDFQHDSAKRLLRSKEPDIKILKARLEFYLSSKSTSSTCCLMCKTPVTE